MTTRTVQAGQESYQGHYAGSVSRFTAYVIDLVVSTGVFALALAAISFGVRVVTGHDIEGGDESLPYPRRYLAHYPRTKAEAERAVLAANGPDLATVSLVW